MNNRTNRKSKKEIVRVALAKKEGTLRIVIPKEAREKLGINEGDYLVVTYDKHDRLIYRKIQNL